MSAPDPVADAQFYAGVPLRRLTAFVIDSVVILLIMATVALVGIVLGFLTFGIGWMLIIPAFALAGFLYRFTMIRERSATLGMMAVGIELRDAQGARLDSLLAALHIITFYATLYVPVLLVVGWIMMALNPRRQMLHDLPLGVVMINRPV